MEEFKNPFKKVTTPISKPISKLIPTSISKPIPNPFLKSLNNIRNSASKTTKGAIQSSKKILAIPQKTKSSSPPPKQPIKYSLQQSDFNNDTYYGIFCNDNTGGYRNWNNQRFDTNKQDIISNTLESNIQGCMTKCNQDKTCTSLHYKKKMNSSDKNNCTLFRSYPTTLKSDDTYQSQVKNNLTFNYNNLNPSQKNNVQKYCIQQYYQNKNQNKKFQIQSCYKNITTKSNKNYIDLDSQCVWNQIQSADMGKTKSQMNFEKNTSIQNPKRNSFLDKYTTNWKEYKENHHQYKNIERDLEKYDGFFGDYQETVGNQQKELKQVKKNTAEGTLATSALLKVQKDITIGIESFENQDCKNCQIQS
jgi:hypothetical protein